MPTPEEQARAAIDRLLTDAGWSLQDKAAFNRNAAPGVLVREFPMPNGPCDRPLFIDGRAGGVIATGHVGVAYENKRTGCHRTRTWIPVQLKRTVAASLPADQRHVMR